MIELRQTWQVSLRYFRVLLRQPAFLVITIVQPLIWLLLFGALFKSVTQIPGFAGGVLPRFPHAGDRRDARGVLAPAGPGWASSRTSTAA